MWVGWGSPDVLLVLALCRMSRQHNALTNISGEIHKTMYFNCSPEISELE